MSSSSGANPKLFMPCLYVVQSTTWLSADPQFAHELRLTISSLGLYNDEFCCCPPLLFPAIRLRILFWFHQHVLPRLLSHLLRGWCIIFRKCIIRCQHCSQVVTFYPFDELRSDAEISPVCRFFRITPFFSSSQDHPGTYRLTRRPSVFFFQISSSLGGPSSLIRIDSTVFRISCPPCHVPPTSSPLRISTLCPLDCLVLRCKPASRRSSCLVLNVVS